MINFKHNLKTLFKQFSKHYPELADHNENYSFLQLYCHESEKAIKSKKLHFGYNSLKWIIFSLRNDISKDDLERLFKNLMFQFFLLNKTPHDIQYNILSFPESHYYKEDLQIENRWESLINKLEESRIGPFPVIINSTGQNLTNKIFQNINPEIIIGANNSPNSKKAIIFKANGYLATKQSQLLLGIYRTLQSKEPGWTALSQYNSLNLFINKESNLNAKDLINVIESHLKALT